MLLSYILLFVLLSTITSIKITPVYVKLFYSKEAKCAFSLNSYFIYTNKLFRVGHCCTDICLHTYPLTDINIETILGINISCLFSIYLVLIYATSDLGSWTSRNNICRFCKISSIDLLACLAAKAEIRLFDRTFDCIYTSRMNTKNVPA